MMPKSDLVGTVPAVKGHGTPVVRPQIFPESADTEKNFSVVVSKAIARTPAPAKPSEAAKVQPPSRPATPASTQILTSVSGEPQPASGVPSKDRREQPTIAAPANVEFMDPSILNAAMTVMVQPNTASAIPPLRSPNNTEANDLAIETESNDANSASATRKPVRFAALAPVAERSTHDESPQKSLPNLIDHKSITGSGNGDTVPGNTTASRLLSGTPPAETVSVGGAARKIVFDASGIHSIPTVSPEILQKPVPPQSGDLPATPESFSRSIQNPIPPEDPSGKTAAQSVEHDSEATSTANAQVALPEEFLNPVSSRLQSKGILAALAADNGYFARVTNAAIHSPLPARSKEKSETTDASQQIPSQPSSLSSITGEHSADPESGAIPQNFSLTELLNQQNGMPHQGNEENEAKHSRTELPVQQGSTSLPSQDLSHKTDLSQAKPAIQAGTTVDGTLERPQLPPLSSAGNDGDSGAQNIDYQTVVTVIKKEIEGASTVDGTRAALSKPRMKFAGEKNDIAGGEVQKVPSTTASDSSPDNMGAKTKPQTEPSLPKQTGDSLFPGSLAYFSANAALTHDLGASGHVLPQFIDSPASQVERIAHLVGQEVLMVRQSSANALAVSLKVDTHTELFLQLTNHDGQVQASLRCERGSIDRLSEHWTELQQSLARQNVQLMPLEDKTSTRGTVTVAPAASSGGVASRPFDQSSQNRQQQLRDPQGETPAARVTAPGRVSGKTKTNNRSRQGWETWA